MWVLNIRKKMEKLIVNTTKDFKKKKIEDMNI